MLVFLTPLITQAAIPPSSSENIYLRIQSVPSCISNHNIIPVIASEIFLSLEPSGPGFLITKDRFGNPPVFVVL